MYLCSLKDFIMKRILCLSIFVVMATIGFAQGSVHIDQDSRIESLIAKQRRVYANDSSYNGYRIHIFMEIGNDALQHAQQVKAQFEYAFPDIPIYLSYVEPHFRLRAGDFRNRVEAEKCLRRIKPRFREAFVTTDKIYRPKIRFENKTE